MKWLIYKLYTSALYTNLCTIVNKWRAGKMATFCNRREEGDTELVFWKLEWNIQRNLTEEQLKKYWSPQRSLTEAQLKTNESLTED